MKLAKRMQVVAVATLSAAAILGLQACNRNDDANAPAAPPPPENTAPSGGTMGSTPGGMSGNTTLAPAPAPSEGVSPGAPPPTEGTGGTGGN